MMRDDFNLRRLPHSASRGQLENAFSMLTILAGFVIMALNIFSEELISQFA